MRMKRRPQGIIVKDATAKYVGVKERVDCMSGAGVYAQSTGGRQGFLSEKPEGLRRFQARSDRGENVRAGQDVGLARGEVADQ